MKPFSHKNVIVLYFLVVFFAGSALFCEDKDCESADKMKKAESVAEELKENGAETEKQTVTKSDEARAFIGTHIFSFDLSYMGLGLKENGWGLGINYEQQLFRFFAVKGGFFHWTLWPVKSDIENIVSVGIKLEAVFYPLGKGLYGPYAGLGSGGEFLSYDGDSVPSDEKKDTAISLFSEAGYKLNVKDYVLFDFFFGYRLLLNDSDIYADAKKYVSHGMEYGVKTKINLSKIIRKLRKR